ncbi:MAG TPA: hypothetical protein VHZ03_42460 [Trebonia sp.]|nr:hypothetical protein [Trebonia sp.]
MSAASGDQASTRVSPDRPAPSFSELLRGCDQAAVHLEMRDAYTPGDPWFGAWQAGDREEFQRRLERPWLDLVREVTGCGVQVRRVRVVSEPVSDYVAFEHATTASNVAAGEQVRWLPRRKAGGLLLPANDCWVFDRRLVRFAFFAGDGALVTTELCDDPAMAGRCTAAFMAAWERAVPHEEYQLR